MKLFSMRAITVLFFLLCFLRLASAQFMPASLPPVISLLLDESRLEMVLDAYDDPSSEHIFVAAHRGGQDFDDEEMIPGNSIANIANAVSKGFDIYESDIEILMDGTLVVFHDNHFNALTNSEISNDLLIERDLDYAKSLFLTYKNNDVSTEQIPTLEEFLTAAKGKIMVKFDLKPNVYNLVAFKEIQDIVVATNTVDQVLIRAYGDLLDEIKEAGYETRLVMRRYGSSIPNDDAINALATDGLRAISLSNITDFTSNELINAVATANAAGLVVEVHEQLSDFTDQQRADAINAGVRQFHSFAPTPLLNYLEQNGHREF